MNTFIRKANNADANDLLILNEKFNGKQDISKEMIERSLETNTSEEVFVAVNNERVIGFCCIRIYSSFCYSVSYAEITEIYVDDEFQHSGIGTKLIEYAQNYLRTKNVVNIQLFTGGENYSAQAFYEKHGYKKTNEIMYRKKDQH